MRSLIAIVAASVVAGIAASPGAATPPSQITNTWSFSYTSSMCEFPVEVATTVHVVTTTFYDSTGAPVRTLTLNRAEGTLTAGTGRVVHYDQAMNVVNDLTTNTRTSVGETSRYTGDNGVILLGVGKVIWDGPALVFVAGQSPQGFQQATSGPIVCNYLAGA